MAGPGGREVGRVSVRVLPDTSQFRRSLERYLQRTARSLRVEIPLDVDIEALDRRLRAYRPPKIQVEADTRPATQEAATAAKSISTRRANIRVTADTTQVRTELRSLLNAGRRLRIDIDVSRLGRSISVIGKAGAALAALGVAATASQAGLAGLVQLTAALSTTVGAIGVLPAAAFAAAVGLASLKIGLTGVGDALKNISDPEKFAEAIAKLAPSARAFAVAVRDLKPAWDRLRLDVQQQLFENLGRRVRDLGTIYLPILQGSLRRTAASANFAAQQLALVLASPGRIRDVATSLGFVDKALSEASRAVAPLSEAFGDLVTVGSSFLPGLAKGFADAAVQFAAFIDVQRESGALAEWIESGLNALSQLGQFLGNLGSAIGGVFSAANAASGGLLQNLASVTAELDRAVHSVEGQTALRDFFAGASDALGAVLPVLGGLLQALGAIGPILGQVGQILGPVIGEVLNQLVVGIQAAAPGVILFAQGIAAVATALAPVLPLVGQLVATIGGVLASFLTAFAPAIAVVVDALSTSLAPLLDVIATSFGALAVAIAPVAEAFAQNLAQALATLAPILEQIVPIFAQQLVDAFGAITPLLQQMSPILTEVVQTLGESLVTAVTALAPIMPQLIDAFAQIAIALLPILPALASLLPPIAQLIAQLAPLVSMLIDVLAPVLTVVAGLLAAVVAPAAFLLGGAITVLAGVIQVAVGIIRIAFERGFGIVRAILSGFWGFFKGLWDGLWGFLSNMLKAIRAALTGNFDEALSYVLRAWTRLGSGIKDAIGSLLRMVGNIAGQILGALGDLGSLLFQAGKNVIQGLINGIKSMIGSVGRAISNVASTIRGALPFSPAKYGPLRTHPPDEAGRTIVDMLVSGITSRVGHVERAITTIAAATQPGAGDLSPAAAWGGRDLDALEEAIRRALAAGGLRVSGRDLAWVDRVNNLAQSRR